MKKKYLLIKLVLLFLLIVLLNWACGKNLSINISSQDKQPISADCRVIKHSMGESCVPNNPQRVVELTQLDNALILGVKPIGAAISQDTGKFYSNFLLEQAEGIENVGFVEQPSLEKILLLKPDLIIGSDAPQSYEQLSKIAPTVIINPYPNWQNGFKGYAEALGTTQKAEQIMRDYQQRIVEFRTRMGDRLSNTQISIVNFYANDTRIYLKQSFAGQILQDVGLPRPPAQDKDEGLIQNLSLEAIPQMAGDVIFLTLGGHEPSKLDKFTSHLLWSQLEAVQRGRVYEVDTEAWIAGWTPVAANLVLDELFKYLINEWK